MNKWNYLYKRDNKEIHISIDKPLDEHLKRHLNGYIISGKSIKWITNWFKNRNIKSVIMIFEIKRY